MILRQPLHILFTLIFVFATIYPVYSQQKEQFKFTHRAIYEMTYLTNSLDRQSQKIELMELLIGDSISLFRSSKKAHSDSLLMNYIMNKIFTMSAPTVIPFGELNQFNYQVLKDVDSDQLRVYDDYLGDNKQIAYYLEPTNFFSQWILKEDTTTINGYLCQRADVSFAGREWTAWFSLDLHTYSVGPYKFGGLPGLIFHVHDANKSWDFMLKDFSKKDTIVSINFREGLSFVKTTKEKLFKNRRDFQKNLMEIREASGHDFGIERKNFKARLEEYILKDNNWIEIFP